MKILYHIFILRKKIDLNNSIKVILIALKIFEEHLNYLRNNKNKSGKTFISQLFEKKVLYHYLKMNQLKKGRK